jgi:3-oxoacyl-[acyl-carrier protein] reductase
MTAMDLGLDDKTALVLGAGSGLGRAMALALGREGARVAVGSLHAAKAEATAQAIRDAGGQAFALGWDLADVEATATRLQSVQAALGPVDVLVNNTGGPPPTTAQGSAPALWRQHFESMVLSIVAVTDAVLPGMQARGWGRIVTSTSSGIVAPIPNLALSNALRMSLLGWSKTLAREVAAQGITVNVVVPGRILTDRIQVLDEAKAQREGRQVEDVAAESAASIPMGRLGTPEEYADAVAFLASTRASYITGSVLRVDGGALANV